MPAGDLVFFGPDLGHMGKYIGGGNIIHAPRTGDFMRISSITSSSYYQGSRIRRLATAIVYLHARQIERVQAWTGALYG